MVISNNYNLSEIKTKQTEKVITAKEWPAFTKKFYNLQVESQSALKEEKEKQRKNNEPIGESWDCFKLKSAINDYNKENYISAYQTFRCFTSIDHENFISKETIQVYSIAMYYIALCKLNGNGTVKNEHYAFTVAKFLEEHNKSSDALK
ncbi:32986_t:CDS:2, partial [Gigaspora margarita]